MLKGIFFVAFKTRIKLHSLLSLLILRLRLYVHCVSELRVKCGGIEAFTDGFVLRVIVIRVQADLGALIVAGNG